MKKNLLLTAGAIGLAVVVSGTAMASDNTTSLGRFVSVRNHAKLDQSNPLAMIVSFTFPQRIQTIGGAIAFLLTDSGYTLPSADVISPSVQKFLNSQLPGSFRTLNLMSIKQALIALGGNSFTLVIDPKNRLVSFLLKKKFMTLYSGDNNA